MAAALKRGDLYFVKPPGFVGKVRPAVIVQADKYNAEPPSVTVCLLTSHLADSRLRVRLDPAPGNGLSKSSHVMMKAEPPAASGLMGEWWEQPPDDDLLVAAMARGDRLVVFLGEPAEITEIYLVREGAGFRLGAGNEMEFPELRRPAMRAALARLSSAVEEVQVYETRDGVALQFGAGATLAQVEADLAIAREVLNAAGK